MPESAILWTHPIPADLTDKRPVCLEYQVSVSNDSFANPVASGQVWTTKDVDYSYKVEPTGLKAKQTYFYRCVESTRKLRVLILASPTARTRTTSAPWDDSRQSRTMTTRMSTRFRLRESRASSAIAGTLSFLVDKR